MSEFTIQQQKSIDEYRTINMLGYALSDDEVVSIMQKEMTKTNRVYPGFESLSSAKGFSSDSKNNVFGKGFNNTDSDIGISLEKMSTERGTPTSPTDAQSNAINFLKTITGEAKNIVDEREKESGVLSSAVNSWKELFDKELAKSTITKEIKSAQIDIELLENAANGKVTNTSYFTKETQSINFEKMFKKRRGVDFSEDAIAECQDKSENFARIKTATEMINTLKSELLYVTRGDSASQMGVEDSSAAVVKAFNLSGITKAKDMNTILRSIEEKYKDNDNIKKYGGNLRLEKNSKGRPILMRTTSEGKNVPATNEQLQIIAQEMSMRLDIAYADALGEEIPQNATAEQLNNLTQKTFDKYKKDYEQSFAKAFGKKDIKILSEKYVQAQQQGVANIEAGLNIASMALMVVPGAATATSGWLLKGSVALKSASVGSKLAEGMNFVDKTKKAVKAAETLQKVQQTLSPIIMTNMTLQPAELVEQLTSENGMSTEEWENWGKSVLQNSIYMTLGIGSSKLAEQGAAMYKTKSLVNTMKNAKINGKALTTKEISAMVKANPVKFPKEIVQSFKKVDNLAKALQISTEVSLDISSTYLANKALGNGDLTNKDWIMSVGFALSGGVLQKQFAHLNTETKIKYLRDAFKEYNISKEDASNILKTMDNISEGKIRNKKNHTSDKTGSNVSSTLDEVVIKPQSQQEISAPSPIITEHMGIIEVVEVLRNKELVQRDFDQIQISTIERVLYNQPKKISCIENLLKAKDLTENEIAKLLSSNKIAFEDLQNIEEFVKFSKENDIDIFQLMSSKEEDFNTYAAKESERLENNQLKSQETTNAIQVTTNKKELEELINKQWEQKSNYHLHEELSKLSSKKEVAKTSRIMSQIKDIKKHSAEDIIYLTRNINDEELLTKYLNTYHADYNSRNFSEFYNNNIKDNPARREFTLAVLDNAQRHFDLNENKNFYWQAYNNFNHFEKLITRIENFEQKDAALHLINSNAYDELSYSSLNDIAQHMPSIKNISDADAFLKVKGSEFLCRPDFIKKYLEVSPELRESFDSSLNDIHQNTFIELTEIFDAIKNPEISNEMTTFVKNNNEEMLTKWIFHIKNNPDKDVIDRINRLDETGVKYDFYSYKYNTEKLNYKDGTSRFGHSDEYFDGLISTLKDENIKTKLGRNLTMTEAESYTSLTTDFQREYVLSKMNTEVKDLDNTLKIAKCFKTKEQIKLAELLSDKDYKDYIYIGDNMKYKISPYDLYDYLKTDEDITAFEKLYKQLPLKDNNAYSYYNLIKKGNLGKDIKVIETIPLLFSKLPDFTNEFIENSHTDLHRAFLPELEKLIKLKPEYISKIEGLKNNNSLNTIFHNINKSEDLESIKAKFEVLSKFDDNDIKNIKSVKHWSDDVTLIEFIVSKNSAANLFENYKLLKEHAIDSGNTNNSVKILRTLTTEITPENIKECFNRSMNINDIQELSLYIKENQTNQADILNIILKDKNFTLRDIERTIDPRFSKNKESKEAKIKFYNKLISDKNFKDKNIPSILHTVNEENIDFAEKIYNDKDISIEVISDIIYETKNANKEFAYLLYNDKSFPRSLISNILYSTNNRNLDFALDIYKNKKVSVDDMRSIISSTTTDNKPLAYMLINDSNIPREYIPRILSNTDQKNIDFAAKICKDQNCPKDMIPKILATTNYADIKIVEQLYNNKSFPIEKIETFASIISKLHSDINIDIMCSKISDFIKAGIDDDIITDIIKNARTLTIFDDKVINILNSVKDSKEDVAKFVKLITDNEIPEQLSDRIEMVLLSSKLSNEELNILNDHGIDIRKRINNLMKSIDTKHPVIESSKNDIKTFLKHIANNEESDNVIKNADFEQFGKNGIPLAYSREEFKQNMDRLINKYDTARINDDYSSVELPELKLSKNDIEATQKKIEDLKANHQQNEVEVIIDGQKVKATRFLFTQGGSNKAYYTQIGDKLYYIKYPEASKLGQSVEEVIASQLYRAAGIDSPNMKYIYDENGKIIGMAGEYVPNISMTPANPKDKFEGFAADAWLANWDAPKNDNTQFRESGVVKVDVGGSLRYRARGNTKIFDNFVNELSTLIEQNDIYMNMTKGDLLSSLKHVTEMPEERITKIINESPLEEHTLSKTLLRRKEYMTIFAKKLENLNENEYKSILDLVQEAKKLTNMEFTNEPDVAELLGYVRTKNGFEGLLNTQKIDNSALSVQQRILADKMITEIEKFTKNNRVADDVNLEPEAKEFLNSILKGVPEFAPFFGKPQHGIHDYSLDIHILKVMQDSMKDPLYAKLNDKDKIVLKFSTLLHDIGKRHLTEGSDTGHAVKSAEYVYSILDKFNLSADVKDRIISIVENHHWFKEYNLNYINDKEVATLCRRPEDFIIYKIMAKADASNVNKKFFLDVNKAESYEEASANFDRKMEAIQEQVNILGEKQVVITASKFKFIPERTTSDGKVIEAREFPKEKTILNGKENEFSVLNLTKLDENTDMYKYGFNKIKMKDLRLFVHMVRSDNNLDVFKTLSKNPMNNSAQSISMISMADRSTYDGRLYGLVLDIDNANISHAYYANTASGTSKNLKHFVNEMFEESKHRDFVSTKFIEYFNEKGIELPKSDYAAIAKYITNKKYPETQIKSLKINDKVYSKEDILGAFTYSRDQLIEQKKEKTHGSHNEIVGLNSKIKAVVAKESSLKDCPEWLLDFAKENNLPIILTGDD